MKELVRTRKATTRRNSTILGFALLTLWFVGHASAEAAQTPATETTTGTLEDGLQRVSIEGSDKFWVRPGVDLRAYDRVALKPITIGYKRKPRHYRIDPSSKTGVLLTEHERERLQRSFYEVFKTGLASGDGFGPASQPDPGLLWVSTSLLNVVVHNNERPTTNELHWIGGFGEMTLRVEFSDSETGETIARFEERRRIGASSNFINSYVRREYSYWTAVRANLARWSELVRQRMHDQRAGTVRF